MRLLAVVLAASLSAAPAAAAADRQPDFVRWVHADAARARQAQAFEAYLRKQGVAGILPLSQILLNSSSWRSCAPAPYSLAPPALWPNIVPTLRFIRARIVPALGPVAALSGYRDPGLNACSGGAPKSAHAQFTALDLTPLKWADRGKMIAAVCRLHARFGAAAHVGLGFYQGLRFHIDTGGYRRWGSDYHKDTSPCAAFDARS